MVCRPVPKPLEPYFSDPGLARAYAAAEEAFFVKCDDENNPPSERDKGRMLALVGVAPSHPFEFVILRVGRAQNQFEITEMPASASGAGVF